MSINRASDADRQRQTSSAQRWLALLERSLPAIYGYVFSQVGNREDAERLTARVFSEAAHRVPDPLDLRAAWQLLCRLARDVVVEHLRQFYGLALADMADMADMADTCTDSRLEWDTLLASNTDLGRAPSEHVEQVLVRLPSPARDLLTLRVLAGQSLEATATALHLSVTQALKLQYDALRQAGEIMFAAHVAQPSRAVPCCEATA